MDNTKNKINHLVYAVDMKESALDSEQFCQICEKSLTWRGKDFLSRTWLQRWKRKNWIQHLCSRTLRPSHSESFVDAWTSSVVASRANHSVLLESVKALKIQDTFSHSLLKESDNADHQLSFSKMLKESCQPKQQTESQFSSMSSESWKAWVTEQRQEYSQRLKSAHLTRESESSSLAWAEERTSVKKNWPTPAARDYKGSYRPESLIRKDGKSRMDALPQCVEYDQTTWPTPTVQEGGKIGNKANYGQKGLSNHPSIVGLPSRGKLNKSGKSQGSQQWATPRANKVHPVITEENRDYLANRNKSNLEEEIAGHCGKAQGKLNPDWVEQLMGLPVGWTQLPIEWID